jgi:small subunit ribosomal protein S20
LRAALDLRYPENSDIQGFESLEMANTYSALKRVRQAERRTEFNRKSKAQLRHQIRAMRRALASKDAKAAAGLLAKTFSIIDRSAKKGIIKKNTAARYKSRLHLRVKALA